jgi:hypothetical protein
MTVIHAEELKKAMQEAFGRPSQNIVLSLGTVSEADLSFFQIICSAHRTAMAEGRTFSVQNFNQDGLMRAHALCGFVRRSGCSQDKTGTCVLMKMSRREG